LESNIEQRQRPPALEGCEKVDRNRIANSKSQLCADGKNYYSQQQCRIMIANLSRSADAPIGVK
jgi:hypothetical protein